MFIRILPTTLLQIFCENLLYFQVIFRSMKIADNTFVRNPECEWVKFGGVHILIPKLWSRVFIIQTNILKTSKASMGKIFALSYVATCTHSRTIFLYSIKHMHRTVPAFFPAQLYGQPWHNNTLWHARLPPWQLGMDATTYRSLIS